MATSLTSLPLTTEENKAETALSLNPMQKDINVALPGSPIPDTTSVATPNAVSAATDPTQSNTTLPSQTSTALAGANAIDAKSTANAEEARTAANVGVGDYTFKTLGEVNQDAQVKSGAQMIDSTSGKATVQGQLEKLLASDSAYIINAENKAKEQAASAGLLGTSMAAGAARRAAIESGLPIAQQDAETYAKATLQEQDTYNAMSRNIADGIVTADLKHYQNTLDQAMANKNTQMNILMDAAAKSNDTIEQGFLTQMSKSLDHWSQSTMENARNSLNVIMKKMDLDQQTQMQTQNLVANLVSGTQGEIMNMMQDPDFVGGFLLAQGEPGGGYRKDADGNDDYTQPIYSAKQRDDAKAAMMLFFSKDIMGYAAANTKFITDSVGLFDDYYLWTLRETWNGGIGTGGKFY